jgi:hypothetical protein
MSEQRQPIDLTDVAEVKEFASGGGDMYDVNAYLKAGWVLFAAHTAGTAQFNGQTQYYSLAWLRSRGEPVHPKLMTRKERWIAEAEEEDAREREAEKAGAEGT